MPEELKSAEEFLSAAKLASECFVKTNKDNVKLKLRTKKVLYTYTTTSKDAEKLLSSISIKKKEIK